MPFVIGDIMLLFLLLSGRFPWEFELYFRLAFGETFRFDVDVDVDILI